MSTRYFLITPQMLIWRDTIELAYLEYAEVIAVTADKNTSRIVVSHKGGTDFYLEVPTVEADEVFDKVADWLTNDFKEDCEVLNVSCVTVGG